MNGGGKEGKREEERDERQREGSPVCSDGWQKTGFCFRWITPLFPRSNQSGHVSDIQTGSDLTVLVPGAEEGVSPEAVVVKWGTGAGEPPNPPPAPPPAGCLC